MTPKDIAINILIGAVKSKDLAMMQMDSYVDDSYQYQQAKRQYAELSKIANIQIDELEAIMAKEKRAEEMEVRTQVEQSPRERAIQLLTPLSNHQLYDGSSYSTKALLLAEDIELSRMIEFNSFLCWLIKTFENQKTHGTLLNQLAIRICMILENK